MSVLRRVVTSSSRSDTEKERYQQIEKRILGANLRGKHGLPAADVFERIALAERDNVKSDQPQNG